MDNKTKNIEAEEKKSPSSVRPLQSQEAPQIPLAPGKRPLDPAPPNPPYPLFEKALHRIVSREAEKGL